MLIQIVVNLADGPKTSENSLTYWLDKKFYSNCTISNYDGATITTLK